MTLPVAGSQTVAGELCWSGSKPAPVVQVLLPGATYNRSYWDFPYQPDTYSYVRRATAAGYTALALDRPGTGASSHPSGLLLGNASEASAVHQVVSALRSGKLAATAFTRVLLVGHSYGSVVAWYEAATYSDVDALLASGMTHDVQPIAFVPVIAALTPEAIDPRFADRPLDLTYLTTSAGARQKLWHGPDDDPKVIATDEATKDTLTTTELVGTVVAQVSGVSDKVTVPVMIAVGQEDTTFAPQLSMERAFYAGAPCLQTYSLPDSGHDLNLSPHAQDWFSAALGWADHVLGTSGKPAHC